MRTPLFFASFNFLLAIACSPHSGMFGGSDRSECSASEGHCEGNVAVVCEGAPGEARWSRTVCPATCVLTGSPSDEVRLPLCVLSADRDPRCADDLLLAYCDGNVRVACNRGYATSRDEGNLVIDSPARDPRNGNALRIPVRTSTTLGTKLSSTCGSRDVTTASSFVSSAPSVATVDAHGNVVGVSIGSATITATSGEHTSSVEVVVGWNCDDGVPPDPPDDVMTPHEIDLRVGASAPLSATARFGACTANVDALVTWTSDDPSIARVDSGNVVAVAPGRTMVRAVLRGVGGTGGIIVGVM